jgi:hypothetical protein
MASNAKCYPFAGTHRPINAYDISFLLANHTKNELNICLSLHKYQQYMAFMTSCNHTIFVYAAKIDAGVPDQFGHSAEMNVQHYGHDMRIPIGMNMKTFLANA